MKYNDVVEHLQNLTSSKIGATEIADIIDVPVRTLYTRSYRNSGFTVDELRKIEDYFHVSLSDPQKIDDCIEIEHIHINPSCGKGTVVLEDAIATPVKIGREIIKDLWHVNNPNVLKLFKASGDSMADTIEDGNILLVDTSRTDYQNGGIYLLTIDNDWFIKRLRKRLTGELDVISDNTKYPIETFKPSDNIEIVVKGRVIKNLSRGL